MNAQTKVTPDPLAVSCEQAERIIAACDAHRERVRVADVKLAALGVLDGFEGAEDELLDELEAVDEHSLWTAFEYPRAAETTVPPIGCAA